MNETTRFRAWLMSRNYSRVERVSVRVVVPIALVLSVAIASQASVPKNLPAAALGSRWILFGLWTLTIFYGFLLLFLPLVRSLRGQLPIELSLQGPKYEEAAATTADALKGLRDELQEQKALVAALAASLQTAVGRIAALEDARPAATRVAPPDG